jgi:hypothetical protein
MDSHSVEVMYGAVVVSVLAQRFDGGGDF